ncbi:Transposable element Hobo transposase [Frankliniella fusca]|uniref:Transposable element Hobo transposase n=1 Tax=Frankliniella fusca TaxID=407009 RepID=A0AAE1GX86_9NEOP|nr:Transposable element Hobo transposase [Frankliniella fusca]
MKEAIADDRCSATTEMWTDENKHYHYLTVTGHFTNSNFEQESWDLCTPKFPSTQETTGDDIRSALVREFTTLGFTEEEFEKVEWVTDQGANVVKALEGMKRYDCMAHCINTALKTSLTLSYVELRKKLVDGDTQEMLEQFSKVTSLVLKAKETPLRQVGRGVALKALQKSLQAAKKGSLMYGAMLSSVLINQKKVTSKKAGCYALQGRLCLAFTPKTVEVTIMYGS